MQRLYRKRIVLGVGGGIAAYKSAELVVVCATTAPKYEW